METQQTRQSRQKLLSIVGPTAVGKTPLSISLAKRFGGEIVNADSRLFYRGMNVGTAKPTSEELATVQHHLVDIIEPDERFSLSRYLELASFAISDIADRDRLPILTGGSGQYVWGLLEGWKVPEIPPNDDLRGELERILEEEGLDSLQTRLRSLDPAGSEKVEMLNPRRVIRAIERAYATGDATGGAGRAEAPPYDSLVIGLKMPREELHRRVAIRIDQMLGDGLLGEVKMLLDLGIDASHPSMSAIGYRQAAKHLRGEATLDEMKEETAIATHRLIGAQHNWFKPRDDRIRWVDAADAKAFEVASQWVAEWLEYGS